MAAGLGAPELLIILVIVIVIFGAGKLPEIGGALGKGIREFRSATKELEGAKKDIDDVGKDVAAGPSVQAQQDAQVAEVAEVEPEAPAEDEQGA